MNQTQVSKLFELLNNSIAALSEKDVRRLLNGQGVLKLDVVPPDKSPKHQAVELRADLSKIEGALKHCETRATGLSLIEPLKKSELESLAHRFDIHVDKSAKKEQIAEKVVERVVGVRLRRHAIDSMVLS